MEKKAYETPMLNVVGRVQGMTAGENGSNLDPGQNTNTKLGFG